MENAVHQFAKTLLAANGAAPGDSERRVLEQVARRRHVARDASRHADADQSLGDRLADRVASVGGSWRFVITFGLFLAGWALVNGGLLAGWVGAFDAYPYIFLNLILSMLAAIQAPIIMMSQNRQAVKDRIAAALDYEVNLKAEIEILALHDKMDRLRAEHLERILASQQEQLTLLKVLVDSRG